MDFTSLAFSERKNIEHQLIAALLRSDKRAADEFLQQLSNSPQSIERFVTAVTTDNLPCLIYRRICDLELAAPLAGIADSSGKAVADVLRQRAAGANLEYQNLSSMFKRLLTELGDFSRSLVWIKGTVLSRTLYEFSSDRFSVDFDAIARPELKNSIIATMQRIGYEPIWTEPGHCHQFGVGPMRSLDDLFLVPDPEFVGCQNLTFVKQGWPEFEIKFSPLETGLHMRERDRFFHDCEKIEWERCEFNAPSAIDHLLVELVHYHKHRFGGWGWLYDIHLLANRISRSGDGWDEFLRRCEAEDLRISAWQALSLAKELLQTDIPDNVLKRLPTAASTFWSLPAVLNVSVEFVWNSNSLVMLFLNMLCTGGASRKLKIVSSSFLPPDDFLLAYYGNESGQRINFLTRLKFLFLHWFILISPAGLVRRTFGPSRFECRRRIQTGA